VEKQLVVRVEQGGRVEGIPLRVSVRVPKVISIEPGTLVWTVGEKPVEKVFRVKMVWDDLIHLLSVSSSREDFTFKIEELTPGKDYAVHVTPQNTAKPMLGLLQFKTDCAFEKFRNPMGFLHIRAAKSP
jgi:hypothetical protein